MMVTEGNKDWPQIVAILTACIPGITSALLFSWTSPFLLVLIKDYKISEAEASILPIFLPIGMAISSLVFYKLPDIIGRKNTLLVLSIPQALFWIITIFARNIYIFYIARFISGIADGIMYAILPIYIGEIANPRVRGLWGNGPSFCFNIGFLMINILGRYFTIQQTAYICLTLPILSLILFSQLPESPYYLLMKGQDENARKSLKWLLRKDDIESDYCQLKKDVSRQISETDTWQDLFKITSNRKALTASIFLRAAQQCAGIAILETYIQYIFEKSKSEMFSPQISSIIFSALLLVMMTAFSLVMDKMGRRKSFIFSSLFSALILSTESLYFYMDQFHFSKIVNWQWFPLTGLLVYICSYSAGLGPLPSLMSSELFSVSVKAKGLAATNVGFGILSTSNTYMFQRLTFYKGLYFPFFMFAVLTFFSCLISFLILPETQGKSLEEIQQELKGNKLTASKK